VLIEKTKAVEDPERKTAMVQGIANFMKMAYVQWNKDTVADETILKNLRELSGGELKLDENFNLNKVEFKPVVTRPANNNRSRNNNPSNNNKGKQNNNNRPQQRNNNNPKPRY
jgi:hypothetical protein